MSTNKVWLWGRLRIAEGEDKDPVLALEQQFQLAPLSQLGKANEAPPVAPLAPLPSIEGDDLGFFAARRGAEGQCSQAGRRGTVRAVRSHRSEPRWLRPSKLTAARRRGLVRAVKDGPLVAISAFQHRGIARDGWCWATGLDDFGFNYPLRALVARPLFGGQGEKEAMYPLRYTDSVGRC